MWQPPCHEDFACSWKPEVATSSMIRDVAAAFQFKMAEFVLGLKLIVEIFPPEIEANRAPPEQQAKSWLLLTCLFSLKFCFELVLAVNMWGSGLSGARFAQVSRKSSPKGAINGKIWNDLKLRWIELLFGTTRRKKFDSFWLLLDHPGGGTATFYGLPALGGRGSPPIFSQVAGKMRSCCQDLQKSFACCCQPVLGEEIQVWGMAAVKISCRRKPNRWSTLNIWIVIIQPDISTEIWDSINKKVACYSHSWMCHAGEYGWWVQRWNPNWRPTHFDGQSTRWRHVVGIWAHLGAKMQDFECINETEVWSVVFYHERSLSPFALVVISVCEMLSVSNSQVKAPRIWKPLQTHCGQTIQCLTLLLVVPRCK